MPSNSYLVPEFAVNNVVISDRYEVHGQWIVRSFLAESKDLDVSCNTVNNAFFSGIDFFGDCEPTIFSGNTMAYGGFGITGFRGLTLSNAIIGPQPGNGSSESRGNMWSDTDINGVFGAKYVGDAALIQFSEFTVTSTTNPFHPVNIDAAGTWFKLNPNLSNYDCPSAPILPDAPEYNDDIRKKVAQGKIAEVGYGLGSQWTASRKLYRRLDGTVAVDAANNDPTFTATIDSFYTNNQYAALGQFEGIRNDIETLVSLSESIQTNLEAIETEILSLDNDLAGINLNLMTAEGSALTNLLAEKMTVLDQLKLAFNNWLIIMSTAQNNRNDLADDILLANENISVTEIYETNRKMVNAVFLSTIAKGNNDFKANERQDLEFIAKQCPQDGGDAVYEARAMLGMYVEEEKDCLAVKDRSALHPSTTTISRKDDLLIYPNPSKGVFSIEWKNTTNASAVFQVYNSTGQKILEQQLSDQTTNQIRLSTPTKGVCFYKLISSDGNHQFGKLIIQ